MHNNLYIYVHVCIFLSLYNDSMHTCRTILCITLTWQKQHCPMLSFLHRYKEIVFINCAYDKQLKKNIKLIFMISYTWNLKNNTSAFTKQR